jgi:hypothetical protein
MVDTFHDLSQKHGVTRVSDHDGDPFEPGGMGSRAF